MNIYTFGYRNRILQDLFDSVSSFDPPETLIVDIRFAPYSKMSPFWSKKNLIKTFGDKYIHLKELGNKNYKDRNSIEIEDLDKGIEDLTFLMDIGYNCILLCACYDYNNCHRRIIAEEIKNKRDCKIVNF